MGVRQPLYNSPAPPSPARNENAMTTQNAQWLTLLNATDLEYLGDQKNEITAAKTKTVVSPLADFGLIRASGEEAASFLHNLMTNDIAGLAGDGVRRAGFCTPKGRLLADFRIWREGDDILLALSADIHAAILKKLSMYVLRAKVKLTDASNELVLLGLAGPEAAARVAALAGAAPASGSSLAFADGVALGCGEQRYLIAARTPTALTLWQGLAGECTPVGFGAWRAVDIAAGEPRVLAATQEEFIPQMLNFVQVGGLSFKKGCYPGQEIVARTQYLGKIKRHMYRAAVAGLAEPGNAVYAPETGDQACGTVVISAPDAAGGSEVLVVVQTSCAESGTLSLGSPSGPALHLLPLPYTVE